MKLNLQPKIEIEYKIIIQMQPAELFDDSDLLLLLLYFSAVTWF